MSGLKRIITLMYTFLTGFALFLITLSSVQADSVLLTQDSYINSSQGQANKTQGGKTFIQVKPGGLQQSFIEFDLSGLGGNVESASLTLYVTNISIDGAIALHQVLEAWSENTLTAYVAPAINPILSTSLDLSSDDIGGNVIFDITELAQTWIDQPGNNFGLALLAETADVRFSSKEGVMGATMEVILTNNNPPPPPPAVGDELRISQVAPDVDAGTIIVTGENFNNGITPTLTLGDSTTLVLTSVFDSFIQAILPNVSAGDYRLLISTGPYEGQNLSYDLTIGVTGADGQPGPQGLTGDPGPQGQAGENGEGSVLMVGTGPGLTGGPITTTGTIGIASGGVTNEQLANSDLNIEAGVGLSGGGAVALGGTTALNNAGVLSVNADTPLFSTGGQTPTISLTGVLGISNGGTGTPSSPTMAGQYLRSAGPGQWEPGHISVSDIPGLGGDVEGSQNNNLVVGIRSRQISSIPPAYGQILKFDGVQWTPEVDGITGVLEIAKGGTGIPTTPTNAGQYLKSTGPGQWGVGNITAAEIPLLGGDVTGGQDANAVVGLQGIPVSSTTPGVGQVLTYNGAQWTPEEGGVVGVLEIEKGGTGTPTSPISAGQYLKSIGPGQWGVGNITAVEIPLLGGDVTGGQDANAVVGLQGIPVSSITPGVGQVLTYNGAQWTPEEGGVAGVLEIEKGGTGIPTSPSSAGQYLKSIGPGQWGVGNITAVEIPLLGGDVTGGQDANTVVGLQGIPVSSITPGVGQVLTYNGAQWIPEEGGVAGVLEIAKGGTGIPSGPVSAGQYLISTGPGQWGVGEIPELAGDVAGNQSANSVIGIQGVPVSSSVPVIGQVLKFNGTSWAPESDSVGLSQNKASPLDNDVFYIASNGNVGLGTANPVSKLTVNGAINSTSIMYHRSDERMKKSSKDIESPIEKLAAVRGVTFEWRREKFPNVNFPNGTQLGVIAQEVEKIIPEIVSTDARGYKSVQYAALIPVLIEAIKDLDQRNKLLQKKLAVLENRYQSFSKANVVIK